MPAILLVSFITTTAKADDDPFRFLEDRGDPRSEAFFREQAAKAKEQLQKLPGRGEMLARVRALSESGVTVTSLAVTASRVFYLKLQAGRMQPALCVREGLAGAERVLLDPERVDRAAAIDWFAPSPDGRHVAYGISRGGSEDSLLRVLAVEGARDLPFEIDRARFNANLAWHPDGRSFYYARVPEGNRGARRYANIRIYRHVLGRETAMDEIVFASGVGGARDVPEFVYPSLHLPLESKHAYAVVREGVRREIAVHVAEQSDLAAGRPRWHKLAGVADEVLAIEGWRDDLYVLSKKNAPHHRVLRVSARAASLAGARVVVPEAEVVLRSMALARDALYLRTMLGGVDRLERVPIGLLGRMKQPEFVRTPFDTAISQLVTDPRATGAILRLQGWIEPPAIMQLDAKSGELRDTRIQPRSATDFSEIDEVRLYAPGHDGTRIPVTLIYRKTTRLTGDNPTLLTAYGAYGTTLSPSFDPARLAWLERGGVFAVAHVRGGGEYGARWHEGGRRATKANTILDAIAVSEFLVRYGFTNPKRLAIMGTSAGGIPSGGALVRRPDLYAAVVARVPVMDMLRFELSENGPANVPEFGSAATAEGAAHLRVMSAYHHVKDGTPYPAVLLTAGYNDPRVDPWQPGKMAGRLQAATTSGKPVLLRVDFDSGHGRGTTRARREEELADIYSFLLWQMGDPQFQLTADAAAVTPAQAGAQFKAGELQLVTRTSSAATRNQGNADIRLTVWYPAAPAAVEAPAMIGAPASPVFIAGQTAPGAEWAAGPRRALVVLSHGFGGVARQMTWLGAALARSGYVVVALDHPGTNGRDGVTAEGANAMWERAGDVKAALDQVLADPQLSARIDAGRIGIAGFSLGGWTAALLAGARTDFANYDRFCASPRRDSICEPQREYPLDLAKRHGILERGAMRALAANERADHRDARVKAAFLIAPALGQAIDAASLKAIAIPVEVLTGSADAVTVPATNAQVFADAIPGTRLTTLPGVGHYDFLSECGPEGHKVAAAYCTDGPGTARVETHAATIAAARRFFGEALR